MREWTCHSIFSHEPSSNLDFALSIGFIPARSFTIDVAWEHVDLVVQGLREDGGIWARDISCLSLR